MNIKRNIIFSLLVFAAPLALNCADLSAEISIGAESSSSGNENPDIPKACSGEFYSDFLEALYLEKEGRLEEAFAIYERLYKSVPEEKTILSSLASIAFSLNDAEAMDKYISAYYALAPQDVNAISLRADLLYSRGDLEGTARLYREALSRDIWDSEMLFKYIDRFCQGDIEESIKYLDLLAERYPHLSGIIATDIAEAYVSQGNYSAATEYLNTYLSNNRYDAAAYIALAGIYEMRGNPDKALATYLEMEKYGLASADILAKIGAYYILQEDKDVALQYFKMAKKLDNSQPSAAEFLISDAESRGDYESALKFLRDSAAYRENVTSYVREGYFLSKLGRKQESVEILDEAYLKFAGNLELAFYYALSLIDAKNYEKAEVVLVELLESSPDDEERLFIYAYLLELQGKYRKMEKVLKKILQLNPDNDEALNFYGYYLIDKTRRVEEGGEYIKKALAANPEDAAFIDSMAWYYYKKKEYEKAYELLGSIPLEDMAALNDAEIYLHLGQTAQSLKLWEDAADYYNKVLEIEPNNKTAKKNLKKVTKKIKS